MAPPRRGPGGAKSVRATTEFEILQKRVCKKKHAKIKEPYSMVDPRTQTEAVPEGAKSHRAIGLFEFFDHVLAAQLPTGSIITSVA